MWVQPRVLVYIKHPRMMNNLDLYQEYELRMLMSLLRTCMIAEALKVCEVALDIRGTFGRFWWRGLLTNLHSIGIRGRGSAAIKSYRTDDSFIVVTNDKSDLCQTRSGVKEEYEYGHGYVLTFLSMACLRKLDMQQCSVLPMICITLVYNN